MPGTMPAIPMASAYPSPDLSAAQLAIMAIVPVGLLILWVTLVYLAARSGGQHPQPRRQPEAPPPGQSPVVSMPDATPSQDASRIERHSVRS